MLDRIKKRKDSSYFPFELLRNEIDSLFEDFPTDVFKSDYTSLDLYEDEKNIYLDFELPGVDKKDIKLDLDNNILKISAEKKNENETKNKNFFKKERYYGKVERAVKLPDYSNIDKVKANYMNGVLKIQIEKKEEAKSKSKEIKIE